MHILNSLVVSKDGQVYAADGARREIYKIDGAALKLLTSNQRLTKITALALSDDGKALYLADFAMGIFGFDLTKSVPFEVTFNPASLVLGGIDGMYWYDGTLVVIEGGMVPSRVMRLQLSADGRSISAAMPLDVAQPAFADLGRGTVVDDGLYFVSNRQNALYDNNGVLTDADRLEPVRVFRSNLRFAWGQTGVGKSPVPLTRRTPSGWQAGRRRASPAKPASGDGKHRGHAAGNGLPLRKARQRERVSGPKRRRSSSTSNSAWSSTDQAVAAIRGHRRIQRDAGQGAAEHRLFSILLQADVSLASAAQTQVRNFLDARIQGFQRIEMREQGRRRLGADARHAGNVVDRIAGEGQIVGDLIRADAETLFHTMHVPAQVARKIPLFVFGADQLAEILVGRDDHGAIAVQACRRDGAADEIVGLELGIGEHAQAQRRRDALAVGELYRQFRRRHFAVGLVIRIDRTGTSQRFIERDHGMRGARPFEKIAEESGEAVDGVDRCAFLIVEFRRHGVPGAEDVEAGVDEMQGVHGDGQWWSVPGCRMSVDVAMFLLTIGNRQPATSNPSSMPFAQHLGQHRPRPFRRFFARGANMHKCNNVFSGG